MPSGFPLSSNEVASICDATRKIVGFELPKAARKPFLEFHSYITGDPKPAFMLQSETHLGAKRWNDRLTNGILDATQNALACVYYHHHRVSTMERDVIELIEQSGVINRLRQRNAGFSPGNTIALDAEYQAFILAARRCLDYLTRALAGYFRDDFHSFTKFGKFLTNRKPATVAKSLKVEHSFYLERFARSLLSLGEAKSTRDLISHYEYMSAGVLNINSHGVFLAGGGEQLGWDTIREGKTLSRVMDDHKIFLQACIENLLGKFIAASMLYERKGKRGSDPSS